MASIAVRVRTPKRAVRQSECGSGCCDAVPIAGYGGVSAAAKPAGNILTVGVEHLDPGEGELDVREGGLHERRVLSTAAGAAHDLPVVQVDEQADVAPAGPGAHVGEVGRHVGAREVAVEAVDVH